MFNPRPNIRFVPIAAGQSCAVIDDFLLDPHALIAHASTQRAAFKPDQGNYYPGVELGLGPETAFRLDEFFMQHIRRMLGARRTISVSCRLSLATLAPQQLSPLQRLCHRDAAAVAPGEGVAASVLYLFEDTRLGGTSFYSPKRPLDEIAALLRSASEMDNVTFTGLLQREPGYLAASNDYFEQVCTIPAAFNRAIFYDGAIFHAAQIDHPALLDADPARGRLTMNGFFKVRRSAG